MNKFIIAVVLSVFSCVATASQEYDREVWAAVKHPHSSRDVLDILAVFPVTSDSGMHYVSLNACKTYLKGIIATDGSFADSRFGCERIYLEGEISRINRPEYIVRNGDISRK